MIKRLLVPAIIAMAVLLGGGSAFAATSKPTMRFPLEGQAAEYHMSVQNVQLCGKSSMEAITPKGVFLVEKGITQYLKVGQPYEFAINNHTIQLYGPADPWHRFMRC